MVGEDIRSQALRNLDLIPQIQKQKEELNKQIEGYELAKLAEKTEFIRAIENLQMRVQDFMMQRNCLKRELNRRDQIEMKTEETIQEKDLEHFRLKLQIRQSDSGEEITHKTQYVQTEQELVEVRTNTDFIAIEFLDQEINTDDVEVKDKFCMADVKSDEWYKIHHEVEVQAEFKVVLKE